MTGRLLWVLRVGLGALFAYAAASKLPDMAAFAEDIANYRVVPAAAVPLLGSALVGVELLVGLALLSGLAARGAALLAAGLLALFIVALAQALLRGIDLRCGCFGSPEPASWRRVAEDLVVFAVALALATFGPGRLRPIAAPAERG